MSVQLDHVRKRYFSPDGTVVPIIDIDEFAVDDGEQVALVGTSGSGKTTLLHLIAGIVVPDEGRILFGAGKPTPLAGTMPDGWLDIAAVSEAHRDVFRGRNLGYIFQTHHLLPGLSAVENVLLGMSFTGRQADRAWAEHLLTEVGLADRMKYKPEKLSVGQQQRVAVARALANRPRMVLADEPTGALDQYNAQQVLNLIRKLCESVNASLLLVTHDVSIAKQLPRVVDLADINRAMMTSTTRN